MQATLNVFRDENATREAKYGLIAANVLIFSTKAVRELGAVHYSASILTNLPGRRCSLPLRNE